jgi:coenzyme F420-reducing hydrogenase delta subunit
MKPEHKHLIYLFYCINSLPEVNFLEVDDMELKEIRLPCTGKLTEIYLLKAFEMGADSVLILGCSAGKCRYLKGNLHALSRVKRVRKYLEEIGLGGERLAMYTIPSGDEATADRLLKQIQGFLRETGPSPLKKMISE